MTTDQLAAVISDLTGDYDIDRAHSRWDSSRGTRS
jgi:hypothetical protein